jgi:hypothetical protein
MKEIHSSPGTMDVAVDFLDQSLFTKGGNFTSKPAPMEIRIAAEEVRPRLAPSKCPPCLQGMQLKRRVLVAATVEESPSRNLSRSVRTFIALERAIEPG